MMRGGAIVDGTMIAALSNGIMLVSISIKIGYIIRSVFPCVCFLMRISQIM
jgi:hypothetical protein